MKYSKLEQAMAAANLANLGLDVDLLKPIATRWSERQLSQSLQRVATEAALLDVQDDLGETDFARMFVSFHFSVYPHIYRALAERSPTRTICSLIGEQAADHQMALRHLSSTFGFEIRFVQSGPRMVREMRAAIADGLPGIILLDIPWSKTKTPPDIRYPVHGGSFMGLSTVARLVRAIDPAFEAVYAIRRPEGLRLSRSPIDGFDAAFAKLGAFMHDDPADYERLHQVHQFFEFDNPSDMAVTFRVKDQRYAILARSMKALKLPASDRLDELEESEAGLCEDAALAASLSRASGEQVNGILCL